MKVGTASLLAPSQPQNEKPALPNASGQSKNDSVDGSMHFAGRSPRSAAKAVFAARELQPLLTRHLPAKDIAAFEHALYGSSVAPQLWHYLAAPLRGVCQGHLPQNFDVREVLLHGLSGPVMQQLTDKQKRDLLVFLLPIAAETALVRQLCSTELLRQEINDAYTCLLWRQLPEASKGAPQSISAARSGVANLPV